MSKKEINLPTTENDVLAELRASYPSEPNKLRIQLPRLGMYSQDKTEGKGKAMKVIAEAGIFYTEHQTDEVNEETNKKIWVKEEIGTSFQGIILFQRKQLRYYDDSTEQYTSSPVYDSEEEVIPLFCDKKEITRGTPKELKEMYEYVKEGKIKSKLEDNRILYVLYKDDIYQLNLRGSSMYSFLSYARSILPPSVITKFASEEKEKGTISWNQMTFSEVVKILDEDEQAEVLEKVTKIKNTIAIEKQQFNAVKKIDTEGNEELDKLALDAAKALD